jgi:HSP20 family molecular chaperone IbpA
MSNILLQKIEPFAPARSSPPCGKAAFLLDRIAPVNPAIPGGLARKLKTPVVGMCEDAQSYTFHAQIADADAKSIKIDSETNTISLSANHARDKLAYSAHILVPGDADLDALKAKYKNGVLELTVPRTAGKGAVRTHRVDTD